MSTGIDAALQAWRESTGFVIEVRMARAIKAYLGEPGDAYLVWSHEHGAWWGPKNCGYFIETARAGRYSREEALEISRTARNGWRPGQPPSEIPVREIDVLAVEARS